MDGTYNLYIIALSVAIVILASYSALHITSQIWETNGKSKFFWLLGSALVIGGGIWSMHFVGMLAMHMHMSVKYDVFLTIISMLASVTSSFIALYITMRKDMNASKIAIGGLVMGSGIVTTHYIGMKAMIMAADIRYDLGLWIGSVVIALAASYVVLILLLRFRHHSKSNFGKWGSAVIMGVAICGMHYTGLKAARLEPHTGMLMEPSQSTEFFHLDSVTMMIIVVLLVSWGAMFFDRHVLERLAYQDTITGMPNRNKMNRFFQTHSATEPISILFLDLDQFKAINDVLGHNVGDLLVQEVGKRLSQFIHRDHQVFRLGGDEFLMILRQSDPVYAQQIAGDVLETIKAVYHIDGNELYVTASIGISIGCLHGAENNMLLRNADTAMYKAKKLGKNQYCLYSEEMGRQDVRKMELEKGMQRALELREFFIAYQPIWNVRSDRLVGFEALIRWRHPRLGVVSPLEFIPIAEETGLIIPMTRWMLEEACKQSKAWQRKGIVQPVSINLSVRLFQSDNLIEVVRNALEMADLEPHLLELEITESIVLHDVDEIIRQLGSIRALGVKVSMDDFGTGYSSIGLLDRMPIDALKLDRSFTYDMDTPSKRAIINAIVLMAENLNLDVIAEGVENKAHIDFLTELGCHVMQGYYYGKPMDIDQIDNWMYEHGYMT